MNRRPLLWFAICWVAGSGLAAALNVSGLWLAGGALAAAAVLLAATGAMSWRLAACCLLAYGLSAGERQWTDARNVTALQDLAAEAERQPEAAFAAEAEGIIVSAVEVDGDLAAFRVKLSAVKLAGDTEPRSLGETVLVRVRLAEQPQQAVAAAWRRGDRVSVAGELELPAAASNIGGFDYRRYLRSQHIHWLLQAQGTGAVRTAPGPQWTAAALLGRIDAARAWLGSRVDALYPAEQAGYMKGLVLGIREDLDPEQFGQFAKLGLTHVLAISGLHVAVFVYALGGLLRLLRLSRENMLMTVFAAVPVYVLLTGGSPSVVRAGLMTMLGLLAARMEKLKDGLHLIAASAVLMLVWNPNYIEDVSFQLSYLVTAGLIIGVPPVRGIMPHGGRAKPLYDLAAVTVVAQLVSFPVSIYYFNQFHLLSLIANFALVPFISFIVMPLGGGALLLGAVWPAGAKLLAGVSVYANELTFLLVDKLAVAESFRTIWATPSAGWIIAWYGVLGAMLLLLRSIANGRGTVEQAADEENETMPLAPTRSDSAPLAAGMLLELGIESPRELRSGARRAARTPTGGTVPDAHLMRRLAATGAAPNAAQGAEFQATGGTVPASFAMRRSADPEAAFSPAAFWLEQHRKRIRRDMLLLLTLGLAAAILLIYAYHPDMLDRSAQVSVLDVGQGDSIYVKTASGRHILIDGGGALSFRKAGEEWRERSDPFEVGADVVAPLLMKRGVHELDLLVVTHLDTDHIKGLLAVMDAVPIKRILWNGTVKDSDEAKELLSKAASRGIPLYAARTGQSWKPDEQTELFVLWPEAAASESDPETAGSGRAEVPELEEQNGHSVALLLRLYGRSFLLPGDIGFAEEEQIGERLRRTDGQQSAVRAIAKEGIDVLKLAHHGSKYSTSEDWLALWRPGSAVASASATNVYGHPSPAVLDRLADAGTAVWRTDKDGEVQFRVSGKGLFIRTAK
ncbi:ComEC/Rec2 family competence protein [Paenibacillus thailandensis]|uniref:ComEC/Rec2 family competence protein n=1 Tax=Paenibacillus thailandensis TaxID=393250 RepID=A0ABW5R1F5_9BACL